MIAGSTAAGDWIRSLRRQALAANHRRLLLLSGDAAWSTELARHLVAQLTELTPLWVSDRPLPERPYRLERARGLLGQDLDLLVYDAHGGFDPDAFGAVSGTLRGGGLLLLLTPPLDQWPRLPDPQAARIAVWPQSADRLSSHFLGRLARLLAQAPEVLRIDPAQPELPPLPAAPSASPQPAITRPEQSLAATLDQARALAAVLRVARGRARRPLVLKAHRGRGKSAALGLAAGQLLADGPQRILVTAPSRAAAQVVFQQAARLLALVLTDPDAVSAHLTRLRFVAPETAPAEAATADLLLVDEAAGIPTPVLERCLAAFPRLVFATTVHGYEGTGRGFEVRFRATLDARTPAWRELSLHQPIRWADGDPLEALTFRALLLDATPAAAPHCAPEPAPAPAARQPPRCLTPDLSESRPESSPESSPESKPASAPQSTSPWLIADQCHCETLAQATLARDEPRLRDFFGLLVLAHYQTRPLDLRMLLDGPNLRLLGLSRAGQLLGALVAALEGDIRDAALCDAIYQGRRRPRGHLLPQTLSAHAGLAEAPAHRYLRIVRIAVHPQCYRRGLGRRLLAGLETLATREGVAFTGASFGATPELLDFWTRCGYQPVQLGAHRNAASGEQALVVLRPLQATAAQFCARAGARLAARLPGLLAGPARQLEPRLAARLLASLPARDADAPSAATWTAAEERQELASFAHGQRTLDAALPLLARLCRRELGARLASGQLDEPNAALLVAALLQGRPLAELVELAAVTGRQALLQRLRQATALLADP